jgi:radical SAM superfamily enzyme YgiQ (UPF0313 family)
MHLMQHHLEPQDARVLVIWPPYVPSYFNAGHRLTLFQVAGHLRRQPGVGEVHCLDSGALNQTWKDLADLLFTGFDVIAIANEYDSLDGFATLVDYARALSPSSKIVTFGRMSNQLPDRFMRYAIDGIVHTGDPEAGVASFVDAMIHDDKEPLPGVYLRTAEGWQLPVGPGRFLSVDDWVMPDVSEIPYDAYDRLYGRDANKFCGIPQRRELVVPMARGCPIGCYYCDVPGREGSRERRMSVASVISYIEESFARAPFEYVAMYAPTFTLNRPWVRELCAAFAARGARWPWKCTTTPHHLDRELVLAMGKSGCIRISIGVETLDDGAQKALPKLKVLREPRLEEIAAWCNEAGIELNCFVILGMPGSTVEGAEQTVARVRALGGRVRPTIYTPYEEMRADMDDRTLDSFNRHLLRGAWSPEEAHALYALFFGHEPRPTQVMERIPERVAP